MALRLVRGIERRPPGPAGEGVAELMAELVRRGEFLSHPHTRLWWREEFQRVSAVIDRESYGDWEAKGGHTALERAVKEVDRVLSGTALPGSPTPSPSSASSLSPASVPAPCSLDQTAALEAIMRGEARRFGLQDLPG